MKFIAILTLACFLAGLCITPTADAAVKAADDQTVVQLAASPKGPPPGVPPGPPDDVKTGKDKKAKSKKGNPNDGKDGDPNDGDAGQGNDGKKGKKK